MLHIITNPQISAKLLEEIATASPKSPISDAEAKKLPYLQGIIKEGLRMCPPASGLLSKDVPAGGDYINGIFVPEGTSIGWSSWGIFRNKQFWGEDANLFRPERWLECSPERLREQEWRLDLVFHSGKWHCLGRGVALLELNKVFVEVSSKLRIL
jgi:cytochrome P450